MSRHALSLMGISKCYHAGVRGCSASVRALYTVSLRVRRGEVLGITGASGAGKSTLLLCAAGLLRPDTGTVLWFGTPHRDRAPSGTGMLAYVPSHPVYYPFLTMGEALEDYGGPSGASASEHHRLVRWAAAVALDEHLHERVGAGPPSRSRQLALALALAARPRLLLLDDTLTELGARAFASIARTLSAVSARGTTIVITARRAEALRGVATRWMTLTDGTLREASLPPAPAFGAIEALPHRAPPARVAEGVAP